MGVQEQAAAAVGTVVVAIAVGAVYATASSLGLLPSGLSNLWDAFLVVLAILSVGSVVAIWNWLF